VNRVYSLAHPDTLNFGLEFTSAFVLPLQGFWNSIIYCAISWSSIRQLIRRVPSHRAYKIGKPLEFTRSSGGGNGRMTSLHSNESTRELAMHPQADADSS
jgi:fatty-acid desaturase